MSQRSPMFIEAIVLDVSDLHRAMTFWTSITGRKFCPSYEANFRRTSFDSGPDLVLQEAPEIKSGKNRVHLDIEVPDLGAGLRRVAAAGGHLVTRADNEFGSHVVCADPDGNEFCLTRS